MKGLQEKFQILGPAKEENETWTSFESQRRVSGGARNQMPPGMEGEGHNLPCTMGEEDVSHDVNGQAFAQGFTKRKMHCTDDQYTGEHVDLFYGDAGGFAERNNYLDRL